MSSATSAPSISRLCQLSVRGRRLITVVGAMAATFTIWSIAHQIVGIDLEVGGTSQNPSRVIGPLAVVITTAIAGLIAWGLLAILERRTPRARTIWTACAIVVLVISLFGPLGAISFSAKIALLSMHLAAAIVLICGFRNSFCTPGSMSRE